MLRWGRRRRRPGPDELEAAVAAVGDWVEPLLGRFGTTPYLAGTCLICGEATVFFCADRRLARETLNCARCGATSRYRSIAAGLLRAIEQLTGARLPSLAALAGARLGRPLAIYDTQPAFAFDTVAYPVPTLLGRCPDLTVTTSSYQPELPPGARLAGGAVNQDLERLTFPDASFDVVVTSDVMEHVRLPRRAHREIRRVLRQGGVYLFTVPHFRHCDTLEFVRIHDPEDPSRDEILGEPQYHGDANSVSGRVLAYRGFGLDLDRELAGLGFTVGYERVDRPRLGLLDTELFYCTVVGPPAA